MKHEQAQSSTLLLFLKQGGWAIYFKQSVWPAALALALLYLTVLSLGLLMTAYLKWQGMSEAVLSVYRGAGAVSGLLATVAFPPIHRVAGNRCCSLGIIYHTASTWCRMVLMPGLTRPCTVCFIHDNTLSFDNGVVTVLLIVDHDVVEPYSMMLITMKHSSA